MNRSAPPSEAEAMTQGGWNSMYPRSVRNPRKAVRSTFCILKMEDVCSVLKSMKR